MLLPKSPPIRSDALRRAAEGSPCILCGSTHGVVLHHIQLPGNHGTGSKPGDFPWGVRVCADCHAHFHGAGRADYQAMALAIGKQMLAYLAEGAVKLT
jgi:hypothetical protein